ncbi:hypothetical protein diail_708 [Diaporthe ilicicola]|nr:hypothetical protein diail_708 [Diaporthe ilicicola]
MAQIAAATDAATTDWVTFDGTGVPSKFMFHAIFLPVLLFAFLTVPGIICYLSLAFGHRGRIHQYSPPNAARFEAKDIHRGPVNNGQVADV